MLKYFLGLNEITLVSSVYETVNYLRLFSTVVSCTRCLAKNVDKLYSVNIRLFGMLAKTLSLYKVSKTHNNYSC
jgi:hypothetical protein